MQHRPSSAAAFTLLEVMIVLAIMMMLAGLGAGLAFNMDDASDKPKDLLIRMARQASRSAVVQGHSVSISFTKTGFGLNDSASSGNNDGPTSASIPRGTVVQWQRWNSGSRWYPIEDLVRWTFYPTGIADALRFRFDDEQGRSELRFNPLTGTPVGP